MGSKSIALSIVVAVDDFGHEAVKALDELLLSLPAVYRHCVRTQPNRDDAALSALRSELADLENTERVKELGHTVLGSDAGSLRVHLYFVGELKSQSLTPGDMEDIVSAHPEDLVSFICLGEDGSAPTKEELRRICNTSARPYLVTPTAGGHGLSRNTIVGGVAGFIFTSISHRADAAGFPDQDSVYSFGFAGKIGLTEVAKSRLAKHVSVKLGKLQLEPDVHARGADSRQSLDDWIERFSPSGLGVSLFSPAMASARDSDRIPAIVTWVPDELGDCLSIQLDRAEIALQLDENKPRTWAESIRKFSRVFDMSRAVQWRLMLERAQAATGETIRNEMLSSFKTILGHMVQPMHECKQGLAEIQHRLDHRMVAEIRPDRDFETSLSELDEAVKAQPNVLALFLKMAIWVIPASIIGAGLFDLLYSGFRGVLFPSLYALTLVAIGVGWPLSLVSKARRRLNRARDKAIDIMVTRQEGIISENAVGYLQELVPLAADVVTEAEQSLEAHIEQLNTMVRTLESEIASELPSPLTLEPVITSEKEYRLVVENLGIDSRAWLKESVAAGCFAVGAQKESQDSSDKSYGPESWCQRRIEDPDHVQLPAFETLWNIRSQCRGSGSLDDAISEVWRRSAPFSGDGIHSGIGLFTCTLDLFERVKSLAKNSGDFSNAETEVSEDAPILACLRIGTLGPE